MVNRDAQGRTLSMTTTTVRQLGGFEIVSHKEEPLDGTYLDEEEELDGLDDLPPPPRAGGYHPQSPGVAESIASMDSELHDIQEEDDEDLDAVKYHQRIAKEEIERERGQYARTRRGSNGSGSGSARSGSSRSGSRSNSTRRGGSPPPSALKGISSSTSSTSSPTVRERDASRAAAPAVAVTEAPPVTARDSMIDETLDFTDYNHANGNEIGTGEEDANHALRSPLKSPPVSPEKRNRYSGSITSNHSDADSVEENINGTSKPSFATTAKGDAIDEEDEEENDGAEGYNDQDEGYESSEISDATPSPASSRHAGVPPLNVPDEPLPYPTSSHATRGTTGGSASSSNSNTLTAERSNEHSSSENSTPSRSALKRDSTTPKTKVSFGGTDEEFIYESYEYEDDEDSQKPKASPALAAASRAPSSFRGVNGSGPVGVPTAQANTPSGTRPLAVTQPPQNVQKRGSQASFTGKSAAASQASSTAAAYRANAAKKSANPALSHRRQWDSDSEFSDAPSTLPGIEVPARNQARSSTRASQHYAQQKTQKAQQQNANHAQQIAHLEAQQLADQQKHYHENDTAYDGHLRDYVASVRADVSSSNPPSRMRSLRQQHAPAPTLRSNAKSSKRTGSLLNQQPQPIAERNERSGSYADGAPPPPSSNTHAGPTTPHNVSQSAIALAQSIANAQAASGTAKPSTPGSSINSGVTGSGSAHANYPGLGSSMPPLVGGDSELGNAHSYEGGYDDLSGESYSAGGHSTIAGPRGGSRIGSGNQTTIMGPSGSTRTSSFQPHQAAYPAPSQVPQSSGVKSKPSFRTFSLRGGRPDPSNFAGESSGASPVSFGLSAGTLSGTGGGKSNGRFKSRFADSDSDDDDGGKYFSAGGGSSSGGGGGSSHGHSSNGKVSIGNVFSPTTDVKDLFKPRAASESFAQESKPKKGGFFKRMFKK